jgi:hypothetical protein
MKGKSTPIIAVSGDINAGKTNISVYLLHHFFKLRKSLPARITRGLPKIVFQVRLFQVASKPLSP